MSLIYDIVKMRQRQVRAYITTDGRSLFEEWLEDLTSKARIRVQTRLDRAEAGNFGDHKSLKDGVFELCIHVLGELRVYYGLDPKIEFLEAVYFSLSHCSLLNTYHRKNYRGSHRYHQQRCATIRETWCWNISYSC